jgi:hypothetical protein
MHQKKPTRNSISSWCFSSYPPFHDVSAEKTKSHETSPECLDTFQSTYMYIVWGVHRKNQLKIRFLGGGLRRIRLFTTFQPKNQN